MSFPRKNTSSSLRVPSILAVGCARELLARCRAAAASTGLAMNDCDVDVAATLVAEHRPVAIVLPNEIYARHPRELDALARDVKATMVRVDANVTKHEIEAMIAGAIQTALLRREGRTSAGRYSIIPGRSDEAPRSTSQRPAAAASQIPQSFQGEGKQQGTLAPSSGIRSQTCSHPGDIYGEPNFSLPAPSRTLRDLVAGS